MRSAADFLPPTGARRQGTTMREQTRPAAQQPVLTSRRPRLHRRLLVGLALCLAPVTLAGWSAQAAPAPTPTPSTSSRYIVVLTNGSDGAAAARRIGASPSIVFSSALNGYAASLTDAQLTSAKQDPQTRWVEADATIAAAPPPVAAAPQSTQAVSNGVKRVGGLLSKTADIDGRDDRRVDVDVAVLDSGLQLDH